MSHSGSNGEKQVYLEDLNREILYKSALFTDRSVSTVFFGGGTPSLMTPNQISALMDTLRRSFCVTADAEITCECNPGTLTKEKLTAFSECGINRLSIGLQSADDRELQMLGRIHRYEDFVRNYALARELGFNNINIDLMSALPGQSVSSYKNTLNRVLALKPEHISAYSLIIEDGTPFFEQLPASLPSEDDERAMYHLTKTMLDDQCYERYEISNYAIPGFECRHNTVYWTRGDYLGLGLGSASLIDNIRFTNTSDFPEYHKLWRNTETYGQTIPQSDSLLYGTKQIETLDRKAQMEEMMFLGLRLTRGVDLHTFEETFAVPIEQIYGDTIRKHIEEKTLIYEHGHLRLTDLGMDVANYVMSDFIL